MNFYPFHIGDYASATRHLSWLEDAAYRRLLDVYYVREEPLPTDIRQVYRLVVASTEEHREAVDIVLAEFFKLTPEGYRHSRCDAEICRKNEKSEKASISAQLSVLSREKRNSAIRRMRINDTRQNGSHEKEEWDALVSVCEHSCVKCGSKGKVTKDHIKPIYQGGSDLIDNIQPLCSSCNSAKGPESIDYRSADWKIAIERLLSERSANASDVDSERSANANEIASERYATKTKTNTNTKVNRKPPALAREAASPDGFAEFWLAYPKKVGKGAAEASWKKTRPPTAAVMDAIANQRNSEQWRRDGGQYIPNPATWLNQRRWEDGAHQAVEETYESELVTMSNGQRVPLDFLKRVGLRS